MRRYSPTERMKCKLYQRTDNGLEFETVPKEFKSEIVEDVKRYKTKLLTGVTASKESLLIKSSNCPYILKVDDKIECLGRTHYVKGVSAILNDIGALTSDKFDSDYLWSFAAKIIQLE